MTPGAKLAILQGRPKCNFTNTAGTAAWYSLAGAASDSTYLLSGSNIKLIADRSGNSNETLLACDGTDYATHTNIILGSGDFSAGAWIYLPVITNARYGFIGAQNDGLALSVLTNGKIEIEKVNAVAVGSSSNTVSAAVWTHVIYVRSSGVGVMYINAVASSNITDANNYSGVNSYLGCKAITNLFAGLIRRPTIYNRALSAAEVLSLYQAGGTPVAADYNNATNTDPTTATPFSNENLTTFTPTGNDQFAATNAGGSRWAGKTASGTFTTGGQWRVRFTTTGTLTGNVKLSATGLSVSTLSAISAISGGMTYDLTLTATGSAATVGVAFQSIGAGDNFTISGFSMVPIGLLAYWDFSTAAKAVTTVTDTSGNNCVLTTSTGARVSGARDLYQGTASKQPVYLPFNGTRYGWTPGVAGSAFRTPSVGVYQTLDLRWYGLVPSFGVSPSFLSRDGNAGNQCFNFFVAANGKLWLQTSVDGTTYSTATSTTSITASATTKQGVRVTRDNATGSTQFYTSTDGVNWSTLDGPITLTSGDLYNSTSPIWIGQTDRGGSNLNGSTYAAQVYNNGVLVAGFDPNNYNSGTTFVGTAGETWTLAGGCVVVTAPCAYWDGSNDYLKSAPFALVQPESVYFTGSQVTWTSGECVIDGGAVNGMVIQQHSSSPNINLYAGANGTDDANWALGTRAVITGVYNGANSYLRVNRNTGTTSNAGTDAAAGITLGAGATPSAYGNITVSELLVRSVADNTTKQNQIISCMERTWGINTQPVPPDSPFILNDSVGGNILDSVLDELNPSS